VGVFFLGAAAFLVTGVILDLAIVIVSWEME
jgi:hypothetical protein